MVLVIWLIVIYFAIRWLALEQLGIGEGGISVNARSGLGYALALLWPFYHVGAPPWPLLLLAVMAEVALVITLALTTPEPAEMHTAPDTPWGLAGWLFVLTAGFLCLLPLWIVDALLFMEARFAYGLLIAFAMLGGWLACRVGRQRRLRRLVAAVVFIILALFAWPQQVRVGHWLDAGRRARSILDQTTTLVPRPAHDSVLVMVGVPFLDRYACYVFGIGLQEALEQRYGRDDFTVVRFDDPDAVGELPDSAYLLYYYYDDEQMELVRTPRVFSHP
jgi:hypothetical protein